MASSIEMPAWDDELTALERTLAANRIYFGHQSVGGNLLQGLLELRPSLAGRIREGGAESLATAGLAHNKLGHNKDPLSKIDAFRRVLDAGIGDKADAALFKFCYVDIQRDTDPAPLLERYAEAILDLRQRFPRLRIGHVTVPLVRMATGPRAMALRLLGRPQPRIDANARRCTFNAALKARFAGEPLFDLAAVESTRPDGATVRTRWAGQTVHGLADVYSRDGGHLNEQGRRVAARAFARFLLELAPHQPSN